MENIIKRRLLILCKKDDNKCGHWRGENRKIGCIVLHRLGAPLRRCFFVVKKSAKNRLFLENLHITYKNKERKNLQKKRGKKI